MVFLCASFVELRDVLSLGQRPRRASPRLVFAMVIEEGCLLRQDLLQSSIWVLVMIFRSLLWCRSSLQSGLGHRVSGFDEKYFARKYLLWESRMVEDLRHWCDVESRLQGPLS